MNNINPSLWGKSGWTFLHCIAHSYPDNPDNNSKNIFAKFYTSLKDILPCEKCRKSYSKHLNKYPLNNKALNSKDNLLEWFTNIRNESNKEINKPEKTLYEYQKEVVTDAQKKPNYKLITYILSAILLISIIIIFILARKTSNK